MLGLLKHQKQRLHFYINFKVVLISYSCYYLSCFEKNSEIKLNERGLNYSGYCINKRAFCLGAYLYLAFAKFYF